MAIGIQGASAGILPQGIEAQSVGINAVAPQDINSTVSQPQRPDNWLKPDLDNPFIVPWGEFDVSPDYKFDLASAYGGGVPKKPSWWATGGNYMGLNNNPAGTKTTYGNIGANDLFGNLAQESFKAAPQGIMAYSTPYNRQTPAEQEAARLAPFIGAYGKSTNAINFKDANLDAAIDYLNEQARGYLMPTASSKKVGGSPWETYSGLPSRKTTEVNNILDNSYGFAPVSRLTDSAARDKMFADTSAKYGIRLDDLQNKYGQYDKAFRSLYDPVGANWQDLKASPTYNTLLGDIRKYSENSTGTWDPRSGTFIPGSTNAAYFDNLNKLGGSVDNPDFLPAEYFILHQPKAALPGLRGDGKKTLEVGRQGTQHLGYSALPGHDPYLRQDWTDYADNNKAAWQYTPEEVARAKEAMAKHIDFLDNTYEEGGPFNLMKEAAVRLPPNQGGTWMWKDSPYTGRLNAAQNMLGYNTQGEKSFTDAGYDADVAARDSMQFIKKKKKRGFLGGLGRILGPIASIASFIPGPWQLPAQLYQGISSAANGNVLGALASFASAGIGLGKVGSPTAAGQMGTGAFVPNNALGNFGGSVAGQAAKALGGGALGNVLVRGGLGAMQGAQSGNALKGALSGATGALAGGYSGDLTNKLANATGNPLLAKSLVGGLVGAGQGAIQGDAQLGAILGGITPGLNAGLSSATGSPTIGAIGTGAIKGAIKTKAQLAAEKKAQRTALARATALRQQGVA